MSKKKVTIGQVLDAIEENGLPQITGQLYYREYDYTEKHYVYTGACAIGQAAINLGVDGDYLVAALDDLSKAKQGLAHWVIRRNDADGWDYKKIARHFRKVYKDRLNLEVEVEAKTYIVKKN